MRLRQTYIETEEEYIDSKGVDIPQIVPDEPTRQTKTGYYKINISWIEHPNMDMKIVDKMIEYLKNLQLEQGESYEVNNGWTIEHTTEFKFNGTENEFIMLKRASMAALNMVAGDVKGYGIVVYGKSIDI